MEIIFRGLQRSNKIPVVIMMETKPIYFKNYKREAPTFANINLLGKCNADCYFCLGKDIPELLNKHNQLNIHFSQWKNFSRFLEICKKDGIPNLYITGQNTDSLLYRYLSELIDYLHEQGFKVGIRTNGFLAKQKLDIVNKCTRSVGYSIHTLDPETNLKIMGRKFIPDWNYIIPHTKNPRVSIVITRYNHQEFWFLVSWLSQFKNIRYIQARRISTDTRIKELKEDMMIYDELYKLVSERFKLKRIFYGAEIYEIAGMEVVFWPTVQTQINSYNYFTDGTISREYFVIEGYLKNYKKGGLGIG